jgi:broad specificity phosphatase PhoE
MLAVGDYLRAHDIDAIVSSPVTRARESVSLLTLGSIPVFFENALRDLSFGRLSGRKKDGSDPEVSRLFEERSRDYLRFRFPEGESILDIAERLRVVREQLFSTQWRSVVIVAHLYVNRILLAGVRSLDLERAFQIPQDNSAVIVADTNPEHRPQVWHSSDGLLTDLLPP